MIGKNVTGVEMSEDHLVFRAGDEVFVFDVEGDCCSWSYFYDFYGAASLIRNGPVTEVEEIDLGEPKDANAMKCDCCAAYGFRLITEGRYGDQSAVVSFRNDSNGYYGGWMNGPSEAAMAEKEVDALVDISAKDWYVVQ